MLITGTHVSQRLNWHMNQLCHLLVTSEYFTSSPPAASRDSHACEHSIILHQAPFEPHLHKYKLDISQALHSLSKFGSKSVQLMKYLVS